MHDIAYLGGFSIYHIRLASGKVVKDWRAAAAGAAPTWAAASELGRQRRRGADAMNTPSAPSAAGCQPASPSGDCRAVWLAAAVLLPFLFVLQISFSEVEIASPPYRPLLSQAEDVLNIALNTG